MQTVYEAEERVRVDTIEQPLESDEYEVPSRDIAPHPRARLHGPSDRCLLHNPRHIKTRYEAQHVLITAS